MEDRKSAAEILDLLTEDEITRAQSTDQFWEQTLKPQFAKMRLLVHDKSLTREQTNARGEAYARNMSRSIEAHVQEHGVQAVLNLVAYVGSQLEGFEAMQDAYLASKAAERLQDQP